jgi:prefoldin subunit 5
MFNQKKKYFKKKLEGAVKMTWDLEFKREKTLMIREEIRSEYDALQAKLHIVDTQIKALPEDKKKWTDEQKRLDDDKVIFERDIARYKEQMEGLDIEVNGANKSNQYPEGVNGINQQIDALRELQEMLKQYIKTL